MMQKVDEALRKHVGVVEIRQLGIQRLIALDVWRATNLVRAS